MNQGPHAPKNEEQIRRLKEEINKTQAKINPLEAKLEELKKLLVKKDSTVMGIVHLQKEIADLNNQLARYNKSLAQIENKDKNNTRQSQQHYFEQQKEKLKYWSEETGIQWEQRKNEKGETLYASPRLDKHTAEKATKALKKVVNGVACYESPNAPGNYRIFVKEGTVNEVYSQRNIGFAIMRDFSKLHKVLKEGKEEAPSQKSSKKPQ